MEKPITKMESFTKEILSKEKDMAKVFTNIETGTFMKGNFSKTSKTAKGNTGTPKRDPTRESFQEVSGTDSENKFFQMEIFMRETGALIK